MKTYPIASPTAGALQLAATPVSPACSAVLQAIQAMQKLLDQPLTLADLADLVALSPFYFHRLFRAATGIPPNQFLTCLRMQEAKRLLLTTTMSVTDTCFAVGYSSLGTFTTRFTQLVGASPRDLRQFVNTATLPTIEQVNKMTGPSPAHARGVRGFIRSDAATPSLTFAGLFPQPIPQAHCVRSAILASPGPYRILEPPAGTYYLLVASIPWAEDPRIPVLPGSKLRVGALQRPVIFGSACGAHQADIALRVPQPTDPPVVTCLPFLLAQRLSAAAAFA